jgi:hypothetical protein
MPREAYAHAGLCPVVPHLSLERLYLTPQTKDMKPIHTNAARLNNKTVKPDLSDNYVFYLQINYDKKCTR